MQDRTLNGATGIVLAGGQSRRMGRDKALIPWRGRPLISRPLEALAAVTDEVIIVARQTEPYLSLGCRVVPDLYESRGPLVGVHAGLTASGRPWGLFAACDMPGLRRELLELLLAGREESVMAVVPESDRGLEPMLAAYDRRCLPALEELIAAGEMRMVSLLDKVPARIIPRRLVAAADPDFRSFVNLNSPEEADLAGRGEGF